MTRQTRSVPLVAAAALAMSFLAPACAPSSGRPDAGTDSRAGRGADTVAPPADAGGAPISTVPLDTAVARPGAVPTDTPPAARPEGPPAGDDAVQRLEREARALVKADGCAQADRCRTAPVGSRPCGGPRTYLVYCPLTTDSAALFSKLAELARAEEGYNRRAGMVSTCELRMPPTVDAVGGRCVAGTGR